MEHLSRALPAYVSESKVLWNSKNLYVSLPAYISASNPFNQQTVLFENETVRVGSDFYAHVEQALVFIKKQLETHPATETLIIFGINFSGCVALLAATMGKLGVKTTVISVNSPRTGCAAFAKCARKNVEHARFVIGKENLVHTFPKRALICDVSYRFDTKRAHTFDDIEASGCILNLAGIISGFVGLEAKPRISPAETILMLYVGCNKPTFEIIHNNVEDDAISRKRIASTQEDGFELLSISTI